MVHLHEDYLRSAMFGFQDGLTTSYLIAPNPISSNSTSEVELY